MTSKTQTNRELKKIIHNAIAQSSGRIPDAAQLFLEALVARNDAQLIIALVGDKLLNQLAIHRIREALPSNGTGASAGMPGAGRNGADALSFSARSGTSDPAMPAGGGQEALDARSMGSSPDPTPKEDIYVRDYFRRPAHSPNKPAVSPEIKGLVAMRGAKALLAAVKCGATPLSEMRAADALEWASRQREISTNLIRKSQDIIDRHTDILGYDVRLSEHFAANLPPTMTVGQFYDEHPDEYRKRYDLIMKVNEAANA